MKGQAAIGLMLALAALPTHGSDPVFRSRASDGTVVFSDAPVMQDGDFQRLAYKDFKGRETAKGSCLGANQAKLLERYESLETVFTAAATEHNIEQSLLRAIARIESCFDSNAISKAGAEGVMQLMPATAASLGVVNSFDATENINAGTLYFSKMIKRFDGKLELALAAYNAGPGAVDRYGGIPPFPETQKYIKRVLAQYEKYRASNRTSSRAL